MSRGAAPLLEQRLIVEHAELYMTELDHTQPATHPDNGRAQTTHPQQFRRKHAFEGTSSLHLEPIARSSAAMSTSGGPLSAPSKGSERVFWTPSPSSAMGSTKKPRVRSATTRSSDPRTVIPISGPGSKNISRQRSANHSHSPPSRPAVRTRRDSTGDRSASRTHGNASRSSNRLPSAAAAPRLHDTSHRKSRSSGTSTIRRSVSQHNRASPSHHGISRSRSASASAALALDVAPAAVGDAPVDTRDSGAARPPTRKLQPFPSHLNTPRIGKKTSLDETESKSNRSRSGMHDSIPEKRPHSLTPPKHAHPIHFDSANQPRPQARGKPLQCSLHLHSPCDSREIDFDLSEPGRRVHGGGDDSATDSMDSELGDEEELLVLNMSVGSESPQHYKSPRTSAAAELTHSADHFDTPLSRSAPMSFGHRRRTSAPVHISSKTSRDGLFSSPELQRDFSTLFSSEPRSEL